jgi:hypothetical protein
LSIRSKEASATNRQAELGHYQPPRRFTHLKFKIATIWDDRDKLGRQRKEPIPLYCVHLEVLTMTVIGSYAAAIIRRHADRRPIIHVGFAHSGTTSLQENFFSRRADLFYAGIPFGDLGGIFSRLKYQEAEQYDETGTARLCDDLIFTRIKPSQRLLVSDETLVDQPAIYYTPAMMPIRNIAMRLRALFGQGTILFTIRNPLRRVISTYTVLKRNAAALGREIEPFDTWFIGNCTQVRNLFLRNLDASHAIKVYQSVFGDHAVHLLPLELLTREGVRAYLGRLSQIIGLEISQVDVDQYLPRNESPKHDIALTPEQSDCIRQRSAVGNAFLAESFDLPLGEYGYPMP